MFALDDHAHPARAPVPAPAHDRAIAVEALHPWALPPPAEVLALDEAGANARNLLLRWPDLPAMVLRRQRTPQDPARAAAVAELAGFLGRRGVPVPSPVAAADGSLHAASAGAWWSLSTYLPGRHPAGDAAEAPLVGAAVGRLHRVLAEVPAPLAHRFGPVRTLPSGEEARRAWRRWSARAETAQDGLGQALLARAKLVESALAAWPPPAPTGRVQLIHGDLHPRNLLLTDRGVAFLDLGGIRPGDPAVDLAFAIHRCARLHAVRHGGADPAAACAAAAAAFRAAYASERPLPDVPLAPLVRAEAFRRLDILLRLHYDAHDPTWDGDLAKHLATLAEADHLGAP